MLLLTILSYKTALSHVSYFLCRAYHAFTPHASHIFFCNQCKPVGTYIKKPVCYKYYITYYITLSNTQAEKKNPSRRECYRINRKWTKSSTQVRDAKRGKVKPRHCCWWILAQLAIRWASRFDSRCMYLQWKPGFSERIVQSCMSSAYTCHCTHTGAFGLEMALTSNSESQ